MPIQSINPTTGERLQTFAPHSAAELETKLQSAERAFVDYQQVPVSKRMALLERTADVLEARAPELGRIMTTEMGKTLKSAMDEAKKCALACRYYAQNGEAFLRPDRLGDSAQVLAQPIGPVLAVMPWNFPFWQVFRFAAPALLLGNPGLLKHASNVPQSALAIENLLKEAGFPDGMFQTLLIGSDVVESMIGHPVIRAVTLTGSEAAGRSVARIAGDHLKKCVLELGGSDPFIVTDTADLDVAIRTAVTARTLNNGQSCIAAKRFIVFESIADHFEKEFSRQMAALKVGDPLDPDTQIGPLATPTILKELEDQVKRAVEHGARVLTGGERGQGAGNFYLPTVLTHVTQDSPAAREELFGPVAPIFRVPDAAAAVRLANQSRFGLGASLWCRDETAAQKMAEEIDSGMVFINSMVASSPHLPFGGIKKSGYGRELGRGGMLEFANLKTVSIAAADPGSRENVPNETPATE